MSVWNSVCQPWCVSESKAIAAHIVAFLSVFFIMRCMSGCCTGTGKTSPVVVHLDTEPSPAEVEDLAPVLEVDAEPALAGSMELGPGTGFAVVIARSSHSVKLGITLKIRTESVKVVEVREGLCNDWNLANPHLDVRVGDTLVQGERGAQPNCEDDGEVQEGLEFGAGF